MHIITTNNDNDSITLYYFLTNQLNQYFIIQYKKLYANFNIIKVINLFLWTSKL